MTSHKSREDIRPWEKWFWSDWLSDLGVQASSLAAQGLWVNMLGAMSRSKRKGYLLDGDKQMESKTLAKITGATVEEIERLIKELRDHEVFSETEAGIIFNRRMVREASVSQKRAEAGRLGGLGISAEEAPGLFGAEANAKQNGSKVEANVGGNGEAKPKQGSASEYASDSGGGEGGGEKPPKPDPEPAGKFKYEKRHLAMAKYLEAAIKENVPYHKLTGGNRLEAWAHEFKIMEGKRGPDQGVPFGKIAAVLEWSQRDDFWKKNILSAATFRSKFGRLEAESRDPKRGLGAMEAMARERRVGGQRKFEDGLIGPALVMLPEIDAEYRKEFFLDDYPPPVSGTAPDRNEYRARKLKEIFG